MKNDLIDRGVKTAVEALLGSLIPQIVVILANIVDYDFSNWKAWLIPLVTSALSTAISAGWNSIQHCKIKTEEEIK